MQLHYLEIVTPEVEAICRTYQENLGARFGEPEPMLGNAHVAQLPSGGRVGVRAPMRDTEEPVIRPYYLVDDIAAETQKAADAGAEIALPPTELPGLGQFSIFIQGGIELGFWQV